jgi:2,4-dienoyl-CoA reductase-like NADH-dependent reductase (Old Yellow Enzyme family)
MATSTADVSVLGKPVTFRNGMKAPNVFLKSAMTERLCTYEKDDLAARGKSTAEYERLYKIWGEGEIGVIVLGNIPIEREGLEAAKNMIIDKSNVSISSVAVQTLSIPDTKSRRF